MENIEKEIDKLIKDLIRVSDILIQKSFLCNILNLSCIMKDLDEDFNSFIFTRSVKLLKSINLLIQNGQNESALALLKSLFECLIAKQSYGKFKQSKKFYFYNNVNVAFKKFEVRQNGKIYKNKKVQGKMYKIKNIKNFTEEKRYFNVYYSFLNLYAHTNLITLFDYVDESGYFSTREENYKLLVRVFTLFAFLRIYKSCIIKVNIEYPSSYIKKRCKELFEEGTLITVVGLKELIRNIPTSNMEEFNKYLEIFKTCMSKMLFLVEIEQRRAIKY
ncbi:MAG: DUF5677 domain-containing protein [Clostridium sp.]